MEPKENKPSKVAPSVSQEGVPENTLAGGEYHWTALMDTAVEEDVFGRRSSCTRSPPPTRHPEMEIGDTANTEDQHSNPIAEKYRTESTDEQEKEENSQEDDVVFVTETVKQKEKKRKFLLSPEHSKGNVTIKDGTLKKMYKKIRDLNEFKEANPNVHKTIKEAITNLRSWSYAYVKQLEEQEREQKDKVEEGLRALELKHKTLEVEAAALREEIINLKKANKELSEAKNMAKAVKTASSQTTGYNQAVMPRPVDEIEGGLDYKAYKEIDNRPWADKVYKNTLIKYGNPLDASCEVVKCTLIEPKDKTMNHSVQRLYKEKYPMLATLSGAFEVLEQQTTRRSKDKDTQVMQEKIVRIEHDNSEEAVWRGLSELKKECREEEQLAIHHLEEWPLEKIRKMTQAVFNDTDKKIMIYTTNSKKERERKNAKAKTWDNKEKTFALVVRREGRDYKEVLRDVRSAVGGKEINNYIQKIRSTREDELLIVLDRNQQATDEVKKLMESQSLKVKQLGQKVLTETFNLRGLDALTSKEEVTEALKSAVGEANVVKVGEMRPGTQNT